jgi:hypothetical protein
LWHHVWYSANLDDGVGAVRRAERPDLRHEGLGAAARDIDGMIDAKVFSDLQSRWDGVEADDAARSARFAIAAP